MTFAAVHRLETSILFAQYSAASFVETINAGSLTMEPDEFLARMLSAGIADLPSALPPPAALTAAAPGSGPGHAAAAIADHVANSPHAHSPSAPRMQPSCFLVQAKPGAELCVVDLRAKSG